MGAVKKKTMTVINLEKKQRGVEREITRLEKALRNDRAQYPEMCEKIIEQLKVESAKLLAEIELEGLR